jgi:tetrahydromethanopterin S-methyltransferase subunit H
MSVLDEALGLAKKAGIEQVLIDCAIPAFAPDMGITVRAIQKSNKSSDTQLA